jgi:hypothetical protein
MDISWMGSRSCGLWQLLQQAVEPHLHLGEWKRYDDGPWHSVNLVDQHNQTIVTLGQLDGEDLPLLGFHLPLLDVDGQELGADLTFVWTGETSADVSIDGYDPSSPQRWPFGTVEVPASSVELQILRQINDALGRQLLAWLRDPQSGTRLLGELDQEDTVGPMEEDTRQYLVSLLS